MKILISGICGFVGSQIALAIRQRFSGDQIEIFGVDNLSRRGSWRNVDRLRNLGICVVHGDVRLAQDLEFCRGIDWLIDAAANPSVLAGIKDGDSRKLVDSNLGGTVNLLECCRRENAGFILLSTSRVYSIPPLASLSVIDDGSAFQLEDEQVSKGEGVHGIREDFSTEPPVSLYGITKLASEKIALEYGSAFDFPVWVNRCGVMAGAGQFGKADQGIFAYWLHSWREDHPLKYIGFGGSGFQVRDCLHPKDLARLLVMQMNEFPQDHPRTINVSGGMDSAISLRQLSDFCSNRWGAKVVEAAGGNRVYDLPWVVLDHSLASETWGWQPEMGVYEILSEIAEFAESQDDWIGLSK
ncbi:MAG: NAD-dependent epimerase/dehydratase family protein [Planctomycetota bacterium]|nr:NAD-dependent epimerase/dehydratase family protein [Planctomycetota bacterium]